MQQQVSFRFSSRFPENDDVLFYYFEQLLLDILEISFEGF